MQPNKCILKQTKAIKIITAERCQNPENGKFALKAPLIHIQVDLRQASIQLNSEYKANWQDELIKEHHPKTMRKT